MKKGILSIIFTLTCFCVVIAQNSRGIRINFVKTIVKKLDSDSSSKYRDRIAMINSLLEENSKDLYYELLVFDAKSVFKQKKILVPDNENKMFRELAGSIGGTNGVFFGNKRDSIMINKLNLDVNSFNIKMNFFSWTITKETKIICGYTCYKAFRVAKPTDDYPYKKEIIAWFTPSLSGFFGPAGNFGLPGTILEVNNEIINLRATEVRFENLSKDDLEVFPTKNIISEDQFDVLVDQMAAEKFGNYKSRQ